MYIFPPPPPKTGKRLTDVLGLPKGKRQESRLETLSKQDLTAGLSRPSFSQDQKLQKVHTIKLRDAQSFRLIAVFAHTHPSPHCINANDRFFN